MAESRAMVPQPYSRLVCAGCGFEVSVDEAQPFSCPRAVPHDDIDHVLQRQLEPRGVGPPEQVTKIFSGGELNPFLAFRRLLHSYAIGQVSGLWDQAFREIVRDLDRSVRGVTGHGFRITPRHRLPGLAAKLATLTAELTLAVAMSCFAVHGSLRPDSLFRADRCGPELR